MDTSDYLSLGDVLEVKITPRGAELSFKNEKAVIGFVWDDVVCLKISRGGVFDTEPTYAVIKDIFDDVPFRYTETSGKIILESELIRFDVNLSPFYFDIYRTDGSCFLESHREKSYSYFNDNWSVTRGKKPDDYFVGFGQKTGGMNKNGRYMQMWNTDTIGESGEEKAFETTYDPYYISIPFFYHIPTGKNGASSASFIDNGYKLHFDLTDSDSYTITGNGGQLTEYFFSGPSLKTILARYTELTGRMHLPPLWALGHHQCRWYDYTSDDILALAEKYRSRNLPCDSLWLDIDYMDGFRIFSWDKKKFPDPSALSEHIEKEGYKLVTIIDPGVKFDPEYPVFAEGVERNLFCKTRCGALFMGKVWPGQTVFPDFVKQETRDWWAHLIGELLQKGLDGIWIDMNEPAFKGAEQQNMRFDRDDADHDHDRYHNQYGLLMAMGTREGLKKARPDRRPFILSRAGFAGIQRYAANWMGDNASRWEHLEMSLPMCCGVGISGQPFVGSDIGGFGENSSEELLVRWYQYGVFQPFCRNHNIKESIDQYPWSFGKKTERIIRKSLELRYRLLPYFYTCFERSTQTGEPIQQPLLYHFQNDMKVFDIDDQFMFGEHLLIAPVLKSGQKRRDVYLPAGGWYLYDKPVLIDGGRTIRVDTPPDICPVFVKAGAVIPTADVVQNTASYAPETIILNIYMPHDTVQHIAYLYEDDGYSYRYLEDEYYRTEFRVVKVGGKININASVAGKGYSEFRRNTFIFRLIGDSITERQIINSGEDFIVSFDV